MVLACETGIWTVWLHTAALENIKHERHMQIIINFYRIFPKKGKPYLVAHFARIEIECWFGEDYLSYKTSCQTFRGRMDSIKRRTKEVFITVNDRLYSAFR